MSAIEDRTMQDKAGWVAASDAVEELHAELTRLCERNAELERERDEAWASAENQLRLANNAAKATSQANARISSLEATVRGMREALKPFGREAWSYEPDEGDNDQALWGQIKITLGDLRRARAAYAEIEKALK